MVETPKRRFQERLVHSREPVDDVIQGHRAELVLPRAASGVPHLLLTPPVVPRTRGAQKIIRVSIFTATTKMRAPSFSLPAGPPKQGGTCPAAALAHPGVPDDAWVCYGCYATTGNYLLPSVQAVQMIRKHWVQAALRAGIFVDQLTRCLAHFHRRERGVKVLAPGGGTRTVSLDPAYFRIHDSGDFSWAGEPYVRAWFEIARAFPAVKFWAPTRDWTFPKMRTLFVAAPSNLVLRPSALAVGAPPPSVTECAAGSTVDPNAPPGLWDCPAYRVAEHSCASADCRTCWTEPTTSVNYAPHGAIVTLKRNPRATLGELATAFDTQATKPNRGAAGEARTLFESFLAAQGRHPADFREADWRQLLAARGIARADDQTAYLEGAAEW